MSKTISQIVDTFQLALGVTHTVTTTTTACTNVRLQGARGGFVIFAVSALTVNSTQNYSLQVMGRDPSGTGSYVAYGSPLVLSAVASSVAGTYLVDLDTIPPDIEIIDTISGSGSQSITFTALLIVPTTLAGTYAPNFNTGLALS